MKSLKLKGFVGGAGIYLLSNILSGVIPFMLLPILTRYLAPSEYGEVAMFQTLLGALGAFVGTVFVGAASRKYYDSDINKEEFAEFIGSCIQLILIFASLSFTVLFIFQDQLAIWLGLKPKYVLLAVVTCLSTAIIGLRLGQWQVQKQAVNYGV